MKWFTCHNTVTASDMLFDISDSFRCSNIFGLVIDSLTKGQTDSNYEKLICNLFGFKPYATSAVDVWQCEVFSKDLSLRLAQ
jgi:hypothetical protein